MKRCIEFLLMMLLVITSDAQQLFVRFPSKALNEKISGKLYIFLSKTEREPLNSINFPSPVATTVINIRDLPPDSLLAVDVNAKLSYPVSIEKLEKGRYYVQAIFDRSQGFSVERMLTDRVGNLYSGTNQLMLDGNKDSSYVLVCSRLVNQKNFKETKYTRRVKVRSALLSKFHNKDIYMNGAIVLPDTLLKNPSARLPLYINVGGFGSSFLSFNGVNKPAAMFTGENSFILLYLDGSNSNGHTVYANSDNNGPWGDALVKELIPEIEKVYHCNGYKYIHGHSSGGWSALYLQVMYPEVFQQCWASSPDSYDFRDFSGINIYEPQANVFYDKEGGLRPSAFIGGDIPIAYVKSKADWEYLVPGEQFNSFNAVFSGKSSSGTYNNLWSHETGAIDTAVANEWKRYDLARYLESHWKELSSVLEGKIFISIGNDDNFLLQGANRLFRNTIDSNKMAIHLNFYAGDHFTVEANEKLQNDAKQYLDNSYKKWQQIHNVAAGH